MATDFMGRQARFRNSKLSILLLLFISCNYVTTEEIPGTHVNANDKVLHQQQGTLYYHKKPFSGHVYELYDNSDTAMVTAYLNGKEHGVKRWWHPNKQLAEERLYVQGRKEGVHKGWWPNGKQKYEYYFSNDEYEGAVTEWFMNGNVYRTFHYTKGHEEGSQKMWWENGDARANYVVKNGERFGLIGQKLCVNTVK